MENASVREYDNLQRPLSDWRLAASLSFVAVAAGTILMQWTDHPLGPWAGIYDYYAEFWFLLLAATVGMVLAIRWFTIPWWTVAAFSFCYVLAAVSLSLVWGLPYGIHDPWVHLATIKEQQLNPVRNAYPVFHSLVILLSETIGLSSRWLLSRTTAISTFVGAWFLLILVRCLPGDRIARQTTMVVMLPGLFVGFVARPFTLALPFVLLFYWFVFASIDREGTGWQHALLGFSFLALIYIHPLIVIIVLFIGGSAIVVFNYRGPFWESRREMRPFVLFSISLGLVAHLLLTTAVGARVVEAAVLSVLIAEGTISGGPVAGVSLIETAFGSWSKIAETLARASYPLLTGIAVFFSVGASIRNRDFDPEMIVTIASGVLVVGLFLVLVLFSPRGIGLFRLFRIAPIVALPAVVRALKYRDERTLRIGAIVLAILLITTGTMTAYTSPLVGGTDYSANPQQVAAVKWLGEHQPEQVVGTAMTYWIMTGIYNMEFTNEFTDGPLNGRLTTKRRAAKYSWNVTDRDPDALYVIDGVERHRAKQAAREGNRKPLRCLRQFKRGHSKVYANDDTKIYQQALGVDIGCGKSA